MLKPIFKAIMIYIMTNMRITKMHMIMKNLINKSIISNTILDQICSTILTIYNILILIILRMLNNQLINPILMINGFKVSHINRGLINPGMVTKWPRVRRLACKTLRMQQTNNLDRRIRSIKDHEVEVAQDVEEVDFLCNRCHNRAITKCLTMQHLVVK